MAISGVSSVVKPQAVEAKKVAPQPRMVQGLANDTFQKTSKTVTNPINTYSAPAPVFAPSLDKVEKKGGKKGGNKKPAFPPEVQVKIDSAKDNMKQKYGQELLQLTFEKDIYTPEDTYVLKAEMKDESSHAEFYDKQMNKLGEEKVSFQVVKDNIYMITKAVDYRNNTTTKVRAEISPEGYPEVTDEVRIVRDKDNNIVRKEMMTHSTVTGAYDHKYVYPDGTEKVISKTRKFKNFDNMDCIHKDMVSLDGTRTQYRLEQDDKGNKLLEYKITDKDGNVLMNLNKTMERVGENKVISSNGDKVHEITFEQDKITIQERGKEEATVIPITSNKDGVNKKGFKVIGDREEMFKMMKNMPAEQLMALTDTIKTLKGVKDTNDCCMWPDKKQIDTINDVFSVLHETGHGIDFRNSKPMRDFAEVSADKELRKIYTEEREAYNKAYPNAQRDHVGYFIQQKGHYAGKWGGLGEVIAEANALRDSYTTEMILAPRVEYLQQHYPKTIAYLNERLANYKDPSAMKNPIAVADAKVEDKKAE